MTSSVHAAIVVSLISICACGTDAPPSPPGNRVKGVLAGSGASAITVDLYTMERLETGLVPIFLRLTTGQANQVVTDAEVSYKLRLTLGNNTVTSAPVIGSPTRDANNFYRNDVIFSQQSATTGAGASTSATWSMEVTVKRGGVTFDPVLLNDLPVSESGRATTFDDTAAQAAGNTVTSYVSAITFPNKFATGKNDIVVYVFKKDANDLSLFIPEDSFTMTVGLANHATPTTLQAGNTDPTSQGYGKYKGVVNIETLGTWDITLTYKRDRTSLANRTFTQNF